MADPMYGKRLARVVQAVQGEPDPLLRLDAVRQCLAVLQDLESATVADARESGRTWVEIGALYGLSKQGAQQRFRAPGRPAPKG